MRAIPKTAVDLVAKWEGCELTAYRDIVGVVTIGFGHTGPEVKVGQKITQAQAKALLTEDLKTAAARIYKRIGPVADELSDNQWSALLSFVFNLGDGNPKKPEWTIWKVLKARKFDEVPAQMMRFVNAGGKRVQGLVNRRTSEVALWHEDEADEAPIPSSVTRSIPTPPTAIDSKPLTRSKSFMTAGATAIATGSAAVAEVSKTITPFADQSPIIGNMISTLAVVGAILAVATLVFVWLKKRGQLR